MTRSPALVGILGWPLDHTLSPTIHNAAFRRMGLDWTYMPFPVPPEVLGEAVRGLRALGARGANVTMPHKETVIPYLDDLSGDATTLHAVNTIQEVGGRFIGHNTDVDGFSGFLISDVGIEMPGKRALVIGAGGAARAVVKSLDDLGAESIVVACRQPSKASWLPSVTDRGEAIGWADAGRAAPSFDLIANATPVGMHGEHLLEGAEFHPGQAVVDLIYKPASTPLVERARASGADAWGGLGMLVHQAVSSFRIWTGQEPPVQVMSAAALHALGGIRHKKDVDHNG